ncbi:MAG: MerR family transcriptional regulator [Deltaproteobacteria bacterium]|jgi:DNA-binding transcriptional MerR regulator|nr:MerR family transcriptional regulator [Deltaproteobacteria bacterium]
MPKKLPEGQLLFKTGEIAEQLDIQPSVVRYWEKEFARHIKPIRLDSGRRLYRKGDLDTFAEIKRLLRVERLTVEGAKLRIARSALPRRNRLFPDLETGRLEGPEPAADVAPGPGRSEEALRKLLEEVRRELFGLRDFLMSASEPSRREPRPASRKKA